MNFSFQLQFPTIYTRIFRIVSRGSISFNIFLLCFCRWNSYVSLCSFFNFWVIHSLSYFLCIYYCIKEDFTGKKPRSPLYEFCFLVYSIGQGTCYSPPISALPGIKAFEWVGNHIPCRVLVIGRMTVVIRNKRCHIYWINGWRFDKITLIVIWSKKDRRVSCKKLTWSPGVPNYFYADLRQYPNTGGANNFIFSVIKRRHREARKKYPGKLFWKFQNIALHFLGGNFWTWASIHERFTRDLILRGHFEWQIWSSSEKFWMR